MTLVMIILFSILALFILVPFVGLFVELVLDGFIDDLFNRN